MSKTKPFYISKKEVYDAFLKVKKRKGAPGIDGQTIEDFEKDLKSNLYKIWNRMSSGSYFPPSFKQVEIPKSDGGIRRLGIPTISDRVAQTVAKVKIEKIVDPIFHKDSYGYRPNKSALDAVAITRKRCWKSNWVIDLDIKGFFDNLSHSLILKAIRHHIKEDWIILYVERWLTASIQLEDGSKIEKDKGTPQGGVVSPVISNLFMHYAFDMWMSKTHSNIPFARFADDCVAHCKSYGEAQIVLESIRKRLNECGLELHPGKTKIVYCKDDDRGGDFPICKFDFLGYGFRARRSKNKWGKHFINFTPAISDRAAKNIRKEIRSWKLHLRSDKGLEDLAHMFNRKVWGWINYYGKFYKSAMYPSLRNIERFLILWVTRKYKRLRRHRRRAKFMLGKIAKQNPRLFAHWIMGLRSPVE